MSRMLKTSFGEWLSEENSIKRSDVNEFINEFGFFITMNLSQVTKMGIDNTSTVELTNMMNSLRKPIINGMTYIDIIKDINKVYDNPKLLSEFLNKIREFLLYVEPRIAKFVKECETKRKWLDKISLLKSRYRIIISQI